MPHDSMPGHAIKTLKDCYAFHPDLEETMEHYRLFSNPIRLKIIHLLKEHDTVCVCDLKEIFRVTAAAVSQHLAKLNTHRVVKSNKEGQTVFYFLTDHPMLGLILANGVILNRN